VARSYDDLDEMSVSKDILDREDDIKVGKEKSLKKKAEKQNKTPYQLQKEAVQHNKNIRIIGIIAIVFVVVLALLIAIGIWMTSRVPQENRIRKAPVDTTKGYFLSEQNIPGRSNQGVKGLLKEAYYTTDGDLAVTLNLSNGTPKDMEVTNVGIRIFNDKDETVAQDKLTSDDFQIEYIVKANGYGEMYFEIDKAHVVKADDPLKVLGTTLEIGCVPTDGSSYEAPAEEVIVGGTNAVVTNATTLLDIPDKPPVNSTPAATESTEAPAPSAQPETSQTVAPAA